MSIPDKDAYKVTITDLLNGDKWVGLTHKENIVLDFLVENKDLESDGGIPYMLQMIAEELPHAYRLGVVDGVKYMDSTMEELKKLTEEI